MPCSVRTVPLPTFIGEQITVSTSSKSKATAAPNYVGNRIGGADFVEVNFLYRHLVNLRLGLRQLAENADRVAPGGLGQVRPLDLSYPGREMAVGFRFLYRHAVFGGADGRALHLFEGPTLPHRAMRSRP